MRRKTGKDISEIRHRSGKGIKVQARGVKGSQASGKGGQ